MKIKNELPTPKKKKINLKRFTILARKVKKYFEEERRYLEEKSRHNEDSNSRGFSFGY